jgi:hypothetical protein
MGLFICITWHHTLVLKLLLSGSTCRSNHLLRLIKLFLAHFPGFVNILVSHLTHQLIFATRTRQPSAQSGTERKTQHTENQRLFVTQIVKRVPAPHRLGPDLMAQAIGHLTHALTGLAAALAGAMGHLTDALARGAGTLTSTLHHLPSPVSYTA